MKYAPQEDNRKYDEEANNLIRTLSDERKYELYDIVLKKQKWSNSPTRDLELVAVAKAIEGTRGIDEHRLSRIKNGLKVLWQQPLIQEMDLRNQQRRKHNAIS